MPNKTPALPVTRIFIWILCLAALSVGVRNFEPGFGADGPLYATIARNIARTGEWFVLNGQIPEYRRFADHPHLAFWIMGAIFKAVPVGDWSARIYGHLFYVGTLLLLFFGIRRLTNEKTAVMTVLLLWIWARFSNPFSNVYLDPGALFFGLAAIFLLQRSMESRRPGFAVAAGLALALCAATKGLYILGFLPAMALCFLYGIDRESLPARLVNALLGALAFLFGAFAYYAAVKHSQCPGFFQLYWEAEMTNRFERVWSLRRLLSPEPWNWILSVTYYMAPLALVPVLTKFRRLGLLLPLALTATFLLAFIPNGMGGGQYFLPLAVGFAWLISMGLAEYLPFKPSQLVKATLVFSLTAVCIIQYLPVKTHGMAPSPDELQVAELRKQGIRHLWIDGRRGSFFISSSRFAWWADVEVDYVSLDAKVPKPTPDSMYMAFEPGDWERRHTEILAAGLVPDPEVHGPLAPASLQVAE